MPDAATRFQALVERSRERLPTYQPPPQMKHFAHKDGGPGFIFMIACSDSRVDPTNIFKLESREANVIRVAGGRVRDDTFRSLEIMGTIVPIELLVVIHHTDCGGLFTTDDEIRERLGARNPECAHLVKDTVFGTFKHLGLDESIRQDVAKLQAWPFLPKGVPVLGYAYETETGVLRQVVDTSRL